MGRIRVIRIPDFKREGKDAFIRRFINKPLEPIAGTVYDRLEQFFDEKYGYFVLSPSFRVLCQHLYSLVSMLSFVRDAHNDEWMARKYEIPNIDTMTKIRKAVDTLLINEMKSIQADSDSISRAAAERKDLGPFQNAWRSILSLMPTAETIEFDKDEVITAQYLDRFEDDISSYGDALFDLISNARDSKANEIIELVKMSNIPASNALYRDIYECLRIADLISVEQQQSHTTASSRYARESFIKAKYQRI